MAQAAGPLVVMLLLGAVVWFSDGKKTTLTGGGGEKAKAPPRTSVVDIASLPTGGSVPEWQTDQGNFQLVTHEGRTVLELLPEPMAEGRLSWARLVAKRGTMRARMWGERTRRAAPRFALGVASSASSCWFRVVPLAGEVQFVGAGEKMLAATAWTWDTERWVWLELRIAPPTPGVGEKARLEGRVWHEGDERPEQPVLEIALTEELGFARALVAAAPYALKPVWIDYLEVSDP
ncbi:MAG TPA: hypothetical protein PLA50_04295 [Bacteroidia bacterium]|nr:hypothetical protein [Bacteroidia bacterium]